MKNKAILLVVLVALVFTVGCRKKADVAKSEPNQRIFAMSLQTLNNPFFVELNKGIKGVVEAHGDKLVTWMPSGTP